MPKKVTPEQRDAVLRLLAQGQDRDTIAAAVGVTPGQVSAISAHVKMGTYTLPDVAVEQEHDSQDAPPIQLERETNLLRQLQKLEGARGHEAQIEPILLGADIESGEGVFWNPDQASGTPNAHVLILGESGTGKTYSISCLTAELAKQSVVSIVFDYGQGFSPKSLAAEFAVATNPIELHAGRDGVNINPLQIFPSDLHGPVNVAQRVADTFGRVYKKIGIQQHAIIRQAVLDVMMDAGIR
jgi:Helicase HerA, central domain